VVESRAEQNQKKMEMIMSMISSTSAPAPGMSGLIDACKRMWAGYLAWRMERVAIGQLRAMSDRELKDIGLQRSQIDFAVRRDRDRAISAHSF
jgi:uncharacterized protein YjiS (DUF1127 family)